MPRFLDRPRLIGACLMLFAVLTFSYAAAAERSPAATMVHDIPSTHPRIPYFERMDQTQNGSIAVSQGKAVTAVMYRRSTKLLQDGLASAGAGLHLLMLPGLVAVEGGLPFVVDGKVIGAIGVPGGSAEQDGLVARVSIESPTK